jgi:hypothetical protein
MALTSTKFNVDHLLLLLVFMSFVSLPVGCHAFVSPMLALLGARFCLVLWSICHEIEQLHLPIYNSPKGAVRVVHHRDFPLVDAVMDSSGVHANFSHHRVSPDLSAMASPTLAVDPSDTVRRE